MRAGFHLKYDRVIEGALISGFKMRQPNIVVVEVCFTSCIPKMRQQLIRAVFLLKRKGVIKSTLIFGFEMRQLNIVGLDFDE